mmetsp:Transcript_56489/g.156375  ORF Transcript_56489/g.156375 Transcript_56489/m.156375 type:complete len:271 (+) Transcript_56489:158-970(+)
MSGSPLLVGGWQETGPWCFTSPWGQCRWDWQADLLSHAAQPAQRRARAKTIRHHFRESWRRAQFGLFLASCRHDAADLTAANASSIPSGARPPAPWRLTTLTALTGADLIDMAMAHNCHHTPNPPHQAPRPRRQPAMEPACFCSWCQERTVLIWHHLARACPAFTLSRLPVPQDALQLRLGWPIGRSDSRERPSSSLPHGQVCCPAAGSRQPNPPSGGPVLIIAQPCLPNLHGARPPRLQCARDAGPERSRCAPCAFAPRARGCARSLGP